jgi:hypothetical protein
MRECVIINAFARGWIPADRRTPRDVFTFVSVPPRPSSFGECLRLPAILGPRNPFAVLTQVGTDLRTVSDPRAPLPPLRFAPNLVPAYRSTVDRCLLPRATLRRAALRLLPPLLPPPGEYSLNDYRSGSIEDGMSYNRIRGADKMRTASGARLGDGKQWKYDAEPLEFPC